MENTAPTGSHQKPAALSQEKILHGYNLVHISYAILAGFIGCIASWHYAFSLDLNTLTKLMLGVGYNAGIIISDITVWYVIEAFKAGEFAGRDILKARLLKFIALLDVSVAMVAHGVPEVAQAYFTWGLPFATLILFIAWGSLIEGGERMMMIRAQAMAVIEDFLDNLRAMLEDRKDKRAARQEQYILNDGRRRARIAFAHKVANATVWRIENSPFKKKLYHVIANEQITELGQQYLPVSTGDGQATKPPVFSVNYAVEKAPVVVARKGRFTKCAGCKAPLPKMITINGEERPWVSRYCPETDSNLATYGQPKSACKTARSRATA